MTTDSIDAVGVGEEEPLATEVCHQNWRHRFVVGTGVPIMPYGTVVYVCPECGDDTTTCLGGCGASFVRGYGFSFGWQDGEMCESCWDEVACYCDNCGEYYHTDDGPCCSERGDEGLYGYDYKPAPVFHGRDPHGAFLGLELEMEATSAYVSEGVDLISNAFGADWLYCKHDGSLSNGLEMVSHPITLEAWQDMESGLTDMLAALRRSGFRSWNTESAGIHIHISFSAFTGERHIWLFQQMFYRNVRAIERFAGRSSHWGRLEVDKGYVGKVSKMKVRGRGYGTERYMAVNLQNRDTLEIRVFRGSLNPERVLANLELVHAFTEYTRSLPYCDVKDGALNFEVFAFWLAKQPNYKHASALIKAKCDLSSDRSA